MADGVSGLRAEAVLALRGPTPTGLARSIAVLASAPAVEGLILGAYRFTEFRSAKTAPKDAGLTALTVLSTADDAETAAPEADVTIEDSTISETTHGCGVRVAEGQHRAYVTDFIRDARAGGCAAGVPPDELPPSDDGGLRGTQSLGGRGSRPAMMSSSCSASMVSHSSSAAVMTSTLSRFSSSRRRARLYWSSIMRRISAST